MIARRFWLACWGVSLCSVALSGAWLAVFSAAVSQGSIASAQEPDRAITDDAQSDNAGDAGIPSRSKSWLTWLALAMGPLYCLLFGFLAFCLVALVVLNVLSIRRQRMVPETLVEVCQSYLLQKRPQEAYSSARADGSLLGKIVAAGLMKLSTGYAAAAPAMQEAGDAEAMRVEHQ